MAGTPVTHASKIDTKCSVEVVETEKASPITLQPSVFVGFEEAGISDPWKWSRWYRKWFSLVMTVSAGMMVSGSTVQDSYAEKIQAAFGFNYVVVQLLVGRSMIWLCVAPLFWGALSDKYGRKPTLLMSLLLYITFSIGAALSRDAVSLLFFKILAGLCGAGPPPICLAILSDIWEHPSRDRGIAFTALAVIFPPMSGLMVTFFGPSNWRGPSWLFIIATSVLLFIVTFTLRETHRPKILREYAKRMRLKTQDGRYLAPSEVFQHEAWPLCIRQVLIRPFGLLREPLLVGTCIHLMLLMACLQIGYTAFPIAFENYPPSAGAVLLVGSGNFSIIIGQILSALLFTFVIHPHVYPRWGRMYAPDRSPPETRLKLAIWASILFTVSFVWSGATLTPSISGWVPIVGGFMMGVASVLIVLVMFNYVMDLYEHYAGSAMAWCVVALFAFQSFFPLFSDQMMQVLTPRWTMLVGGAGALLTIPFPWLLKRYGRVLREYSQYIQ